MILGYIFASQTEQLTVDTKDSYVKATNYIMAAEDLQS